jgi:hypothetical protein
MITGIIITVSMLILAFLNAEVFPKFIDKNKEKL